MARPTFRGGVFIRAADMAHVAARADMRSDQRETGRVMIKNRLPIRGGVARLASRGEARQFVIGIIRIRIILLVAIQTCGGCPLKLSIHMTLLTVCRDMRTGQRKLCARVVEESRSPPRRSMALCAIMRQLRRFVVGRITRVIIRLMARPTIGRSPGKLSADMTLLTTC
jgi:hypothetical protein